jgi:hypothetical protein
VPPWRLLSVTHASTVDHPEELLAAQRCANWIAQSTNGTSTRLRGTSYFNQIIFSQSLHSANANLVTRRLSFRRFRNELGGSLIPPLPRVRPGTRAIRFVSPPTKFRAPCIWRSRRLVIHEATPTPNVDTLVLGGKAFLPAFLPVFFLHSYSHLESLNPFFLSYSSRCDAT